MSAEFLPRAVLIREIQKSLPSPGKSITDNVEILVWTAAGKILPNVIGQPLEQAKTILKDAGFRVGKITAKRINLPLWQDALKVKCAHVTNVFKNVESSRPIPESVVVFLPDNQEPPAIQLTVGTKPQVNALDGAYPRWRNGRLYEVP